MTLQFQGGVAIRFRWIWVGKLFMWVVKLEGREVAIRFRWIWVGKR